MKKNGMIFTQTFQIMHFTAVVNIAQNHKTVGYHAVRIS